MRPASEIKQAIRNAFKRGEKLTTLTGNILGHTVDFRKIVSDLRREGMNIVDYWTKENGKRFKVYFLKRNGESDKTPTNNSENGK